MPIETITDIPAIASILDGCARATEDEVHLIAELALLHALAVRGVDASPTLSASFSMHHENDHTVDELVRVRLSDLHPSTRGERDRLPESDVRSWALEVSEALFEATKYLVSHLDDHPEAAFITGTVSLQPEILRGPSEAYLRRIAEIFSVETIHVDIVRSDDGIVPINPIAA